MINSAVKTTIAAALLGACFFAGVQARCAPPPKTATPTLKSGMIIVQQSRFLGRVVYYGMGDDVKMSSSFFTFIVRGKKHKGYMLSSGTRKYVEVSENGFEEQVNMFSHDDRLRGTIGLSTDKKAKWSDWKVTKHTAIRGIQAKCWTREWTNHPKGMGLSEEVYVAETIEIPKTLISLLQKVDPHETLPFKGFVLRHQMVYTGPRHDTEVQVDTADWRPLKVQASTFDVPADFTKVKDFTTLMVDDTGGGATDPFTANILERLPKSRENLGAPKLRSH